MQTRVTATEVKVAADQGESLYKPSVDVLAESARAAFGKNVLGVMLTGMGGDGAQEFAKLRKMGKNVTLTVHQGTGHAFMGPHNALGTFNAEVAAKVWPQAVAFLKENLA